MWDRLPKSTRTTVGLLQKNRAGSLAAEAAFFGLLSIPPLLVGMVAGAGFVARAFGQDAIDELTERLISVTGEIFTTEVVNDVISPTIEAVLSETRIDALSLGFVFSIWSASRMVNALLQGIALVSNQMGYRNAVRTRLLAIKAYLIGLVALIVILPVMAIGPQRLLAAIPTVGAPAQAFGFPLSLLLGVLVAIWLIRTGIPQHPPFKSLIPGGILTLVGWIVGGALLQWWVGRSVGGVSIYGPLSAPIAVLLWLQLVAFSTLAGAAYTEARLDRQRERDEPEVSAS
jgi:membrane protein